jgi:hypothetical protein
MIVEPTNRNPRFFSAAPSASDSGVCAGSSPSERGRLTIGQPFMKVQANESKNNARIIERRIAQRVCLLQVSVPQAKGPSASRREEGAARRLDSCGGIGPRIEPTTRGAKDPRKDTPREWHPYVDEFGTYLRELAA